jgi:serine/threonine protein phosphatase PrpC
MSLSNNTTTFTILNKENINNFNLRKIVSEQKKIFDFKIIAGEKNQDFVKIGKYLNNYYWIVCCDGHGDDTFINIIKNLQWDVIMEKENSYEYLINILKNSANLYNDNSGSTLAMVKIFPNKIYTLTIGDSRILIFKNSQFLYKSNPHNLNNNIEKDRFKYDRFSKKIVKKLFPIIISSVEQENKYIKYITFNKYVTLNMTQSIGHKEITGYYPEHCCFSYNHTDKIKILVGSDGFFDMILLDETNFENIKDNNDLLIMNIDDLLNKVKQRWQQEWIYYWNINNKHDFITTKFEENKIDDISLAIWSN